MRLQEMHKPSFGGSYSHRVQVLSLDALILVFSSLERVTVSKIHCWWAVLIYFNRGFKILSNSSSSSRTEAVSIQTVMF